MKRLLLIPVLAAPMWLYSCMHKTPVPDPVSVIREAHEAMPTFPPVIQLPTVPPAAPKKPKPKKHAVVKAKPAPRIQPEPEPQPAKPPCLFDFIAPCWPQQPL